MAITLSTSSPSHSSTYPPFVLHLLILGIIASAIAHIHITNSESLIHPSVFTVVQHAPAIGLVVEHISFPSLSIITQIQHLLVFNTIHILSIHSQQLTRISIHFSHFIQTQFHYNRMGFLNQPFMISIQSIMPIQHQIRILDILLQYPFTILLILQDLHQWNQHFIVSFFAFLHKWMLLIILITTHSHPSTHSHSIFLSSESTSSGNQVILLIRLRSYQMVTSNIHSLWVTHQSHTHNMALSPSFLAKQSQTTTHHSSFHTFL